MRIFFFLVLINICFAQKPKTCVESLACAVIDSISALHLNQPLGFKSNRWSFAKIERDNDFDAPPYYSIIIKDTTVLSLFF